jgi:hypothetical protein
MTRRSICTVVGSIFMGLLVAFNSPVASAQDSSGGGSAQSAVSARRDCNGNAREQCEAMVAAQDAALSAAPVHILGGNGIGQEQFEATEDTGYGQFVVAVPTNVATHVESGYAPENYEQMLARQPIN